MELNEGSNRDPMKKEDFIMIMHDTLEPNLIDWCEELIKNVPCWDVRDSQDKGSPDIQDVQITLENDYTNAAKKISMNLCNTLFSQYCNYYPMLKGQNWMSAATCLQRTQKYEGYHRFHCENDGYHHNGRQLAWMVYLNDVDEGGETEFLFQGLKIKPERNKGVIWPGGFTHTHRGNPPISNTKYILTGWISTNDIFDIGYGPNF